MGLKISEFKAGQVYSFNEIQESFGVSLMGGMNKSNRTQSLVLVSRHEHSKINPYEDKWVNDELHYTGEGSTGDQILHRQNKTLAESNKTDTTVYLFEVIRRPEYIYRGVVEVSGDIYQEYEPDKEGNSRLVYKFPLKLKDQVIASGKELDVLDKDTTNKTAALSADQVIEQAKLVSESNKEYEKNHGSVKFSRQMTVNRFNRDPKIARAVKLLSNGVCALCEKEAPFNDVHGDPYLHAHHIKYLSNGGTDSIDNTVAICPNCHEKIHILENPADKKKLLRMVEERDTDMFNLDK